MFCSDADGDAGRRECERRFAGAYQGRVLGSDCRYVPWSEADPGGWPWMLELFIPVMKGEYRLRPHAQEHAAQIGGEMHREGSREDRQIQARLRRLTEAVTA